jgi:hypothetical protein
MENGKMTQDELKSGAARHPEDTEDRVGEFIHGEERDEGVGELTPLPEDAGGDTPPERDALAELEEAVGRSLSDDLTAEATHLSDDDTDDDEPAFRRYAGP